MNTNWNNESFTVSESVTRNERLFELPWHNEGAVGMSMGADEKENIRIQIDRIDNYIEKLKQKKNELKSHI